MLEKALVYLLSIKHFKLIGVSSGWPSGLRRQTQGENLLPSKWYRGFWSPNGGVGSNSTPDKSHFVFELVDALVFF